MGGIPMGGMAEMKFDLDMSSPRGRNSIGKHGDACEHGHTITKEEIKKICNNYELDEEDYTIGTRTYKFLSMFNENNDDIQFTEIETNNRNFEDDSFDISEI